MMHYSVFSQTQPVKWLKIHRRRRKKSKWPSLLPVQRQQQYCMVILYFLRMSFCSGSYALTVQRWSSMFFRTRMGFGVGIVCVWCVQGELWCWVHVRWAWRSVHSNGVGQCYSLRAYWCLPGGHLTCHCQSERFFKAYVWTCFVSKWSEHILH